MHRPPHSGWNRCLIKMAPCFNMNNPFKYARNTTSKRKCLHLRRFQDPIQHEKYYAFLKHRAQARFRRESYRLTWEDWQTLWTDALWSKRGRKPQSLRLTQRNPQLGWNVKNCAIVPHGAHMSKLNQARNQARHKQHI